MHRLTVCGTFPKESIPSVCGVTVEDDGEGLTFIADRGEDMQRLKRLLSFSLADMITREYEHKRLSDYIDALHPQFLPRERQTVLQAASAAVLKTPPERRMQYIEDRLYTFLTDANQLSLDGFINFRLKEYKSLLKKAATAAVDVYLAEKEYEEFITLLKLYIMGQGEREPCVHVVVCADGGYSIFDKNGVRLEEKCEQIFAEGEKAALCAEDMLLSALLSLAPEEITFHNAQNLRTPRLLETLVRVFSGRVHICEKCPICKSSEEK